MKWLAIVLAFALGVECAFAEDGLYMMTSMESPWSSVEREDLKALYIGKRKSLERTPCRPILLVREPDYSQFINDVIGNTPHRFERNWKKLLFSGKATLPKRVETLEEAFRQLRSDPSAVCFARGKVEADGIRFVELR